MKEENDYGRERIGITSAANYLGVTVTQLKEASLQGKTLNGVAVPKAFRCGPGNYLFRLGDIVNCKKEMDDQ